MRAGELGEYEIDELIAFCRQYPDKRRKAADLLGIQSSCKVESVCNKHGVCVGVVLPHGNGISSPVENAAMKRDKLLSDCRMIEKAAEETAGGGWEKALIRNLCYQESYDYIPRDLMPSSHRSAYFAAKREFLIRLKAERDG